MKIFIIMVIILCAGNAIAEQPDWQQWVHKKADELKQSKLDEKKRRCDMLRDELKTSLFQVEKQWPICSPTQAAANWALKTLDKYEDAGCWRFDMLTAMKSEGQSPFEDINTLRQDLFSLRAFLGECK